MCPTDVFQVFSYSGLVCLSCLWIVPVPQIDFTDTVFLFSCPLIGPHPGSCCPLKQDPPFPYWMHPEVRRLGQRPRFACILMKSYVLFLLPSCWTVFPVVWSDACIKEQSLIHTSKNLGLSFKKNILFNCIFRRTQVNREWQPDWLAAVYHLGEEWGFLSITMFLQKAEASLQTTALVVSSKWTLLLLLRACCLKMSFQWMKAIKLGFTCLNSPKRSTVALNHLSSPCKPPESLNNGACSGEPSYGRFSPVVILLNI